ncbi:Beta-lactamase domain-containing protein 2 [Hondaea fermentalgiana]|uniref:Beta-lactamase domain-containing protein 2 n=1 Tax=Hondaea fermentalgiana TaxID=2315210 RepID=A0A2R5GJI2_9STRA|nr:Beta-lactamase domain-containing protein 2 [Hondaea fermentalgiana]|eukprot:GBG28441.1 Beta-lactamase domain-containing protein 2 [Hondaea fermentalgiana]
MGLRPSARTLQHGVQLLALRELWVAYRTGKLNKTRLAVVSALLVAISHAVAPRFPLWARVLGIGKRAVSCSVEGEVAPGFEAVRAAFQQNVDEGLERGAQFVAYYKGKKVVDLAGGTLPGYNANSHQVIFSNSKTLSAIVVAKAVAAGRLQYEARVSEYWPEFAQNGKEDITVADVLRHDSGLPYFSNEEKVLLSFAERDNLDKMADFLAKQAPFWLETDEEPKTRIYHALTRDFITGELVRRVDPAHRSLGKILRAEVAVPLDASFVLGPGTEAEKNLVSPLAFDTMGDILARFYTNFITGGSFKGDTYRMNSHGDPSSPLARSFSCIDTSETTDKDTWFNDRRAHDAEVGSAGVRSNARSLGKLADAMARRALLPEDVHDAAVGDPVTKYDSALGLETSFTQGGFCKFGGPTWDPSSNGFVGWGGFGGSQVIWNEDLQVGVAYAMNGNRFGSLFGLCDERFIRLQKAVVACVGQAEEQARSSTEESTS